MDAWKKCDKSDENCYGTYVCFMPFSTIQWSPNNKTINCSCWKVDYLWPGLITEIYLHWKMHFQGLPLLKISFSKICSVFWFLVYLCPFEQWSPNNKTTNSWAECNIFINEVNKTMHVESGFFCEQVSLLRSIYTEKLHFGA